MKRIFALLIGLALGAWTGAPGWDGSAGWGGRSTWNGATGNIGGGAGGSIPVSAPPPGGDPTIGILPTERDFWANWKVAGLTLIGGIPTRNTQCGATVNPRGSSLDDTGNINNAIAACTAGQFVNLGSGTFTIAEGSTININKGVTLRGQGPGTTILQHPPGSTTYSGGNCSGAGAWGATFGTPCPGNNPSAVVRLGGGVGFGSPISLSSDTVVGSFTVSVTSATGISVGSLVNLDELGNGTAQPSPDWITSGGVANQIWASSNYDLVWNAHNPTINFFDSAQCLFNTNNFACGSTDPTAYSIRAGGVMEEYHLVSGISGTTITFDSPVMRIYHTANSAALTVFTATNEIQQAGLENVTVQYGDNDNIDFQGCIYCWASGIESTNYLNPSIHFQQGAFRDYLTNYWVHEGVWPVNGGGGYNIALTRGPSEILIDNGISMKANKCIVMRASGAGSVVAYNYMDDQYIGGNPSWVETCLNNSHLVGPGHNLFEGNWAPNADSDYTHGAVSYGTYYRNNITGIRAPWTSNFDSIFRDDTTGCCSPQRAASSHPYTYWTSFVGNILGTSGLTTPGNGWDYQNNAFTNRHLLMLGWNDANVGGANITGPDSTANVIYPADPTLSGTTGRFASSTGCMSTTNCTTIVDGNYDYVNAAVTWDSRGSVTLPSSFYLTAVPGYFTGYTWPPVNSLTPIANEVPAHNRWRACQPTPTAACLFSSSPQVALIATPSTILVGQSSTLTWNAFNAVSCAGTGFSTGGTIYGTASTGALTPAGSYPFTVTCAGVPVTATVTVNNPVASTWDPLHQGVNTTLSGVPSNTIVTRNVATGSAETFSTQQSSAVHQVNYFEIKCIATGTNNGLGVMTTTAPNSYVGSDGASFGFYRSTNGALFQNGAVGSWTGCVAGDTVGVKVDETVSPPTIAAATLHAGTWGAFSSAFNMGSSLAQGVKFYIVGDPEDAADSDQICSHSACAASPAGIPGGAVWFDGF